MARVVAGEERGQPQSAARRIRYGDSARNYARKSPVLSDPPVRVAACLAPASYEEPRVATAVRLPVSIYRRLARRGLRSRRVGQPSRHPGGERAPRPTAHRLDVARRARNVLVSVVSLSAAKETRKRRSTATANFGSGRREGHDASAFYDRFVAPEVSTDTTINRPSKLDVIYAHDARHMDAVAVQLGGPRRHVAALLRGQAVRRDPRCRRRARDLFRVPRLVARRVRRMQARARARRSHRRQRRQSRPASLPLAVERRDRDLARPRSVDERRGDLGQGQGRRRVVRVGHVPAPVQSGAP